MPDRHRRAGQRRALLQRQMRWNFYSAIFLEHGVFREHTVDATAQRALVHVGCRRTATPALKEVARDAIADLHLRDARTDFDHFAGAVRQRNKIFTH